MICGGGPYLTTFCWGYEFSGGLVRLGWVYGPSTGWVKAGLMGKSEAWKLWSSLSDFRYTGLSSDVETP